MSLRPRFSLLTLLFVTALVAGGVKLWHGPHWRTLSDPLTALDQSLIAEHASDSHFQVLLTSEVKCKYLNTWSGPELLLIHGQPRADAPLLIGNAIWHEMDPGPDLGGFWYFERAIYPGTISEQAVPRPGESIRSWYAPPFLPSPSFRKPPPIQEPTRTVMYTILPPHLPHCYFVSDRKHVYQSQAGSSYFLIAEIQVSEIPNPELRTLIEQELAMIPEPH